TLGKALKRRPTICSRVQPKTGTRGQKRPGSPLQPSRAGGTSPKRIRQHDGFRACWTHADELDRNADQSFDAAQVALRAVRQVIERPYTARLLVPALERLVDRLGPGYVFGIERDLIELAAP